MRLTPFSDIFKINRLPSKTMDQKFDDIYELTPLQEGILFHTLVNQSSSTYLEQYSFSVTGKIDLEKFQHAFDTVFSRHDILRTAFIYDKVEKPLQVVLKKRYTTVVFRDIAHLTERSGSDCK